MSFQDSHCHNWHDKNTYSFSFEKYCPFDYGFKLEKNYENFTTSFLCKLP